MANRDDNTVTIPNHGDMWRVVCKVKLPKHASLRYVEGVNPWENVGSPGYTFYTEVLAKKPSTVGAALDLAEEAGIAGGMQHLAWFVTWGPTGVKPSHARPLVGGLVLYASQEMLGANLAALWSMPVSQANVNVRQAVSPLALAKLPV